MSDTIPPLSPAASTFKPGIYQHYKGGVYHALFVGRSSEDPTQEFVVYQSVEHGYVWIRPFQMFIEGVEVDGRMRPRFAWVKEA